MWNRKQDKDKKKEREKEKATEKEKVKEKKEEQEEEKEKGDRSMDRRQGVLCITFSYFKTQYSLLSVIKGIMIA